MSIAYFKLVVSIYFGLINFMNPIDAANNNEDTGKTIQVIPQFIVHKLQPI